MVGIIIGIVLGAVITGYAMRGYMHWRLCVEVDLECIAAYQVSIRLREAALVWEQSRGLNTAPALEGSIAELTHGLETTQARYHETLSEPFVYRLLYDWRDSGMIGLLRSSLIQSQLVAVAIAEGAIEDAAKQAEARSASNQPPTTVQAP